MPSIFSEKSFNAPTVFFFIIIIKENQVGEKVRGWQ